ncbi:MAG: hypothetical protein ACRDRR_20845 [Pseudonocardiaceae bacterium]
MTLVALNSAERFSGLFASGTARGWGFHYLANDAERLADELITRAVETTGNPDPHLSYIGLLKPPPLIGIRISLKNGGLLIEVWDSDPTSPLPAEGSYLDDHLTAVQERAQRWNWYRPDGGGKIIWAELAPRQPQRPAPLSHRAAGRFHFLEPDER